MLEHVENSTIPLSLREVDRFEETDSDSPQPPLGLSLVIPTRNERDNIATLVQRIDALSLTTPFEIIFVDDSTDTTPEAIAASRTLTESDVVLIHREPEQRVGGLGGAVIEGIRAARSPYVLVMDADLQHPPELIPDMLNEALRARADVVVASRYRDQGDIGQFGAIRAAFSRGTTVSARLMFPNRLRDVTDPMSGFFLVRRQAVDLTVLKPDGFKILLEILGRTPNLRIREVPFTFGQRLAGESKASLYEGLRFFRLLLHLRFGESFMRFVRFGAVGVSGLFVNSLLLALNTEVMGLFYLIAALIATQGSTLWNFVLTEWWVFPNRQTSGTLAQRGILFFVMNNVVLVARIPILFALTSVIGIHYLASNLISLVILMVLRYFTADRLIWGDGFGGFRSEPAVAQSLVKSGDR